MPSLAAFARLLAAAASVPTLIPLARALGFTADPLPLDTATLSALGIAGAVTEARIVPGRGALRALLVECPAGRPLRDAAAEIAARLGARSPHLLWMLIAVGRGCDELALAGWYTPEHGRARIAALLTSRGRLAPSDAETLAALAAVADAEDVLVHAGWLEVLGRDAITRRFYAALERLVGRLAAAASGGAREVERDAVALLYVSRLLFLCFLETRGWLDGDHRFLENGFARCMAEGGGYHHRVLLPLFFGTLNTPVRARSAAARAFGRVPFLNGGLFARTAAERRAGRLRFPDEQLGALYAELLSRYRFTAREEQDGWSETAVDPEMLGKVFESLMAARARKESGSYYTPQQLVARVSGAALGHALAGPGVPRETAARALAGEQLEPPHRSRLLERVRSLRVLDPACGSGAFLVYALEALATLARHCGDTRAVSAVRREILTRGIFGVDVNPTAVWLCELRLWLSVVIESETADPLHVPPLPNLDRHIRVGDALSGEGFTAVAPRGMAGLARLRERYARSSGARKRVAERALERAERTLTLAHLDAELARCAARRRDLLSVARGRDLFGERHAAAAGERARLRAERERARELRIARRRVADGGALPFAFATHFPDAAAAGGFDAVVGNPPWVRLHRIPAAERARLRARFVVFAEAAWRRGAEAARTGVGFAAQVDLAALFVERSLSLARENGAVALLVPAKLWCSLAGGGVRRLLATRAELFALEDWSSSSTAFDAAVYPSLVAARRRVASRTGDEDAAIAAPGEGARSDVAPIAVASHRRAPPVHWAAHQRGIGLDSEPGSPWLLAPPAVRAAFDRLRRAGPALADAALGRITLGVKCGCNEAFIVAPVQPVKDIAAGALAAGAFPAGALAAGELAAGELATGGRAAGGRAAGGRPSRAGAARARAANAAADSATGASQRERARVAALGSAWHCVEPELLRPLLRGSEVVAWHPRPGATRLIFPHDAAGRPLAVLPPGAGRWLERWKHRLAARADARGRGAWWSLFRLAGADHSRPRVVWADVARAPRALVLEPGDRTVPLNSCYVIPCGDGDDAHALAALLNSALAAAWLALLAEPARGGYRRFLAWTVSLLPLPAHWARERGALAALGRSGAAGAPPDAETLLRAVVRAYGLRRRDLDPLLAWTSR